MSWWPWWTSGLMLGGVALAYWWTTGRLLSGSGMLTRVVERPQEAALEDPAAFLAAMNAATAEAFGASAREPGPPSTTAAALPKSPPRAGNLIFLGSLIVGGLLARITQGDGWVPRFSLGAAFEHQWGVGVGALLAMGVGGLLVGFGTRMAGGCTVGHGLSGCSRLQPGSLVGTALFMGTAIGLSLALTRVAS